MSSSSRRRRSAAAHFSFPDQPFSSPPSDFFRDALRFSPSILPSILPSVLLTTLWSFLIYSADTFYGRQWECSSAIVGPLSVVVSLLLVFRTGTCFEKWHEARRVWGEAEAGARGVGRWVWGNVDLGVPEAIGRKEVEAGYAAGGSASRDTLPSSYGTAKSTLAPPAPPSSHLGDPTAAATPSHESRIYARRLERKKRAIRLLSLFFTALAHELRDEHGADWPDYEGVLMEEDRRRWEGWHQVDAGAQPGSAGDGEAGERRSGYDASTLRSLAPDAMGTVKSVRRRAAAGSGGGADGDGGRPNERDVEAGPTSSDASGETTPLLKPHSSSSSQRQRPPLSATHTLPTLGLALYSLQQLSLYLTAARRAGMLESAGPAGFAHISTLLASLTSAHASLHRIKSAAIPVAYGIHLKQCTAAYLLALPLTLVTELGWEMIPFVTLVAVTLLGVVGINGELEVPFGDDASDHHLGLFVAAWRSEVEWMMARVPEGAGEVEEVCG